MFQTGTFGGFLVGQETWLRTFFLLWGLLSMAGVKPKMAHFWPKMAKIDRLFNVPKKPKRIQSGPRGQLNGSCPSGPVLGLPKPCAVDPKVKKGSPLSLPCVAY